MTETTGSTPSEAPATDADAELAAIPTPAPKPARKTSAKAKRKPVDAGDGADIAPPGGGSWIRQSDGTLKRSKD